MRGPARSSFVKPRSGKKILPGWTDVRSSRAASILTASAMRATVGPARAARTPGERRRVAAESTLLIQPYGEVADLKGVAARRGGVIR